MQNKTNLITRDPKKEKPKEEYAISLGDDLVYEHGYEEQLISNLQEKYEMSREEIKKILKKL